jgi:hypothetical protein
MIPTQSALRAYDTSHLTEHAAHWRDLAARRRNVVGSMNAQANLLDWMGEGNEAMKAAMRRHLSTAEEEAGLLDAAARAAEDGASVLHQKQQSMLSGVDQARRSGFVVGEDWSATDAMFRPGSMGWYARQSTAQAISADLRTQAGAFARQEAQTASDVVASAGDLGGEGAVRGRIQDGNGRIQDGNYHPGQGHVMAVDNVSGGNDNGPQPPPAVKITPHPNPPSVITMHVGEQPGRHECPAWQVGEDVAEGIGGPLAVAGSVIGGIAASPLGPVDWLTALTMGFAGVAATLHGFGDLSSCK